MPSIDEGHYAIAVFGLPARMGGGDPATLKSRLKPQASLKREGKKALKASDVQFLSAEDGSIVLFLFPRSNEIALVDKEVEFAAKIGRVDLSQKFRLSEMNYAGKLEL